MSRYFTSRGEPRTPIGIKRQRPTPKCAREGCPNLVKDKRCRWCSYACVSKETRRGNRLSAAYKQRRRKFSEELRILGRVFTTLDLLKAFSRIDERAYQRGWLMGKRQRMGLATMEDIAS